MARLFVPMSVLEPDANHNLQLKVSITCTCLFAVNNFTRANGSSTLTCLANAKTRVVYIERDIIIALVLPPTPFLSLSVSFPFPLPFFNFPLSNVLVFELAIALFPFHCPSYFPCPFPFPLSFLFHLSSPLSTVLPISPVLSLFLCRCPNP